MISKKNAKQYWQILNLYFKRQRRQFYTCFTPAKHDPKKQDMKEYKNNVSLYAENYTLDITYRY